MTPAYPRNPENLYCQGGGGGYPRDVQGSGVRTLEAGESGPPGTDPLENDPPRRTLENRPLGGVGVLTSIYYI